MADKQIGIRLDVKSTGLSQVDDTLETISKNLQGLNENVMQQQQKGWGSDAQTKNLREQLRSMEQMLQTAERLAKAQGVTSGSFGNFRNEIGSMQRDLGNLPTYKSRAGGWVHDRFGSQAASQTDRLVNWTGKAAAIGGGLNLMSTIRSGLDAGTQLAYGYGDLAKRMAPNMDSYKYGRTMGDSLQGYGYTGQDLLQNSVTYAAATGRMDTGKFTKQMQAIEQLGRGYGLDLSGVTQQFASTYQSGVTGGSDAQLSPQEYANLVANAVNRGNMQGKESQVMGQLQQLIQMGVSSSGQAGDVKTMSGMLSIGDKTGNQALISQLPQMLGAISNGMMSPGGGYAGQALMWNAISGGQKMGYFEEQVQAAKGAFGVNEHNGKTNIENAMTYLSKTFGGKNMDQESVMLSTLFPGINPAQAKQFIQAYTNPDGSFKQGALDAAKNAMGQPSATPPQNATDKNRNQDLSKQHAADNAGSDSNSVRSPMNGFTGDLINAIGTPLADAMSIIPGISSVYAGYKAVKGTVNLTKKIGSKWTSKSPNASPDDSSVVDLQTYAKNKVPAAEGPKLVEAPSGPKNPSTPGNPLAKGLGFLSDLSSSLWAQSAGFNFGDFVFGHTKGGVVPGTFATQHYSDSRDPVWKRLFESGNSNTTSTSTPKVASPGVTPMSATAMPSAAAGAALAPIVASTIVALGPYMGQLKTVLGSAGGATSQFSGDLVSRGNQQTISDLVNRSQNNSVPGYQNMSNNSMVPGAYPASYSNASGSAVDAVSYWSQKYGVPTYVSDAIAMAESSMNPNASGDNGTSWGLFQLHQNGGQGTGYTADQLKDPMLNSQIGLKSIASAYQKAKSMGMQDGPQLAQWVAEQSGHPGYGVHSPLDDKIFQNAQGILSGSIKIKDATLNINVSTPDGSQQKLKAPLTASFEGLQSN